MFLSSKSAATFTTSLMYNSIHFCKCQIAIWPTCMWRMVLSTAVACTRVTVHPPNPPPVILLPKTPSTSMAAATSSSSSLQLTSYRSLLRNDQSLCLHLLQSVQTHNLTELFETAGVPQGAVALHHKLSKFFVCSPFQCTGSLSGPLYFLKHMASSSVSHIIHLIFLVWKKWK